MTQDAELELFHSVEMRFQPLIKEFAADDDQIEQHYSDVAIVIDDKPITITKPPTASDAIQNAADHILTDPRITVPVRPVGADAQGSAEDVAERAQLFHSMWWNNAFVYCGDPLGRVKTPVVKGKGVLKVTVQWDKLPTLPDRPTKEEKDKFRRQVEKVARSGFLWKIDVVPKETVFEVGDPWDPDGMFEHYRITPRKAREMFPQLDHLDENDVHPSVEYIEYWEKPKGNKRGKFIQWVDGDRVHDEDNPYCWEHDLSTEDDEKFDGFVPYTIIEPGWGDVGPDDKPEERYVSLLRRARSVNNAEAEMLTSMREYLKMYVFPPVLGKNIPGDADLTMAPGKVWSVQEGQEIGFLGVPEMPVGLLQGLSRINAYVDQTAKLGSLGGTPQRGVDTATEADQNIRNAATKLSGPIRGMRLGIMRINMQARQTIEKVLEVPVTLYGSAGYGGSEVTLKPSDINGFYLTEVELDTSDEAALNLRNARTWSDISQRFPISMVTAMRNAGVQNGKAEIKARTVEDLVRSPDAQRWLIMQMLPELPQQAGGGAPPVADNAAAPETIDQQARAEAQDAQPERAFR